MSNQHVKKIANKQEFCLDCEFVNISVVSLILAKFLLFSLTKTFIACLPHVICNYCRLCSLSSNCSNSFTISLALAIFKGSCSYTLSNKRVNSASTVPVAFRIVSFTNGRSPLCIAALRCFPRSLSHVRFPVMILYRILPLC